MPSSGPIDIKDRFLVGALEPLEPLDNSQVAFHRRSVAGSLIGGIAETQEVLDFCAEHGIVADVEIIPIQKINKILCRSEYIQAQAF